MDIRDVIEEKYTNYLNCETDDLDLTIEEAKFILANDEKVHFVDDLLVEAYKVVLSELVKKDEIIDEMAEHTVSSAIVDDTVCSIKCDCDTDILDDCTHEKMLNCTKQYFTKKVDDK